MAQITFPLMVLSLTIFSGLPSIVEPRSKARVYLEAQCRTAVYRELCVETLLPYVTKTVPSPQQLAQISLAVCLSKATQTKVYVTMVAKRFNITKNSDQAIGECLNQINNGVNQIILSVKEFQQMRKDQEENFVLHEGNVQSWVSAALTYTDICLDGYLGDGIGGREKAIIKAKILNMKHLASNSLVMFKRYTIRYRASHIVKNP